MFKKTLQKSFNIQKIKKFCNAKNVLSKKTSFLRYFFKWQFFMFFLLLGYVVSKTVQKLGVTVLLFQLYTKQ